MSLRDLARRANVSHAAPAHHFKDKAGLLTAIAVDGYDKLGDALRADPLRAGPDGHTPDPIALFRTVAQLAFARAPGTG